MKTRYGLMFSVACFFLGLALFGQVLLWGGRYFLNGAFQGSNTENILGIIFASVLLLSLFLVWLIVNTVAPLICFIILCCIVRKLNRPLRVASIVLLIISGILSLIQIYFLPTMVHILI